nr:zinc finger, PHD-type, DC1 [Tanacetum cinerariifolium]
MIATHEEHGCQDGFCMVATYKELGYPEISCWEKGDLGAITSKGGPPNHMRASEKELTVLKSPLEQKSMFKRGSDQNAEYALSKLLQMGTSLRSINYKLSEHPFLLHLPFCDQTDMLMHFHGESGSKAFETNLSHPFHQHPLTLVDTPWCNNDITTTPTSSRITRSSIHGESGSKAYETDLSILFRRPLPFTLVDKLLWGNNDITTTPTSSRITTSSIHDSMKMVEVVCNACTRPIKNIPFYKCTTSDDGCNFVLHASCTRLPTKVKLRGHHSEIYNFKRLPQGRIVMGVFPCYCCKLICNGFVYNCHESGRDFDIDVHCALSRQYIRHKSHPNHLLPKVENYSGDYFCEVYEEEFNPNVQLITAVGIIALAAWGVRPLLHAFRILFLQKNDNSWAKSKEHQMMTSYIQPLLLWGEYSNQLSYILAPSQAVKQRLLNFVRSLSTVLAFAYCLS